MAAIEELVKSFSQDDGSDRQAPVQAIQATGLFPGFHPEDPFTVNEEEKRKETGSMVRVRNSTRKSRAPTMWLDTRHGYRPHKSDLLA